MENSLEKKGHTKSFSSALNWLLMGGVIFVFTLTLFLPQVLVWYSDPVELTGVQCGPSIRWALQTIRVAQGGVFVLGGIIGLVLYWKKNSRERA